LGKKNAKRISSHVLRCTCAHNILQATGDLSEVALCPGHKSIHATVDYLRADVTQSAFQVTKPSAVARRRRRRCSAPPYDITLRRLRDVFMIKNLFTQHDRILTIHDALVGVNAWTFEGPVNHNERPFKRTSDTMIQRQLMRTG